MKLSRVVGEEPQPSIPVESLSNYEEEEEDLSEERAC